MAAMATAAAAPPITHWARPVIMGIPPVLTLELPLGLPLELPVELTLELPLELPVGVDPELVVVPAAPLVVVAEVEAMVLLPPVAPGAAPNASTMVTAWAPRAIP